MSRTRKNRRREYQLQSLEDVVTVLKAKRNPKSNSLPQIEPDINQLAVAINQLPTNQMEAIEKFFGLLPDTPSRYRQINKIISHKSRNNLKHIDPAILKLQNDAGKALSSLIDLENLIKYDSNFQNLCNNILSKIDRPAGMEDLDCLKYLSAYVLIICNGPNLITDRMTNDLYVPSVNDEKFTFDSYAIFSALWNQTFQGIADNSFRLSLVVSYVDNLELRKKVQVYQAVHLQVPKDLRPYKGEPVSTFADYRKLCEKLFPKGPWLILETLCFRENDGLIDFTEFANLVNSDKNWMTHIYDSDETLSVTHPNKVQELPVFYIGNILFTDTEELDLLYLARDGVF